jgi:hypothetical protein
MRHGMAEDELPGVVVAVADGRPGEQRRKLRIPIGHRRQVIANRSHTTVGQLRADQAQAEGSAHFPARPLKPETAVDVLGGSETSSGGGGEQILKVGNGRDGGSFVFAMGQSELRHQAGGSEVVHAGLGIHQVGGFGVIKLLQQVVAEAADIGGLHQPTSRQLALQ